MTTLHEDCQALCAHYRSGRGVSRLMGSLLSTLGLRRPVLVRGQSWLKRSGHEEAILADWPVQAPIIAISADPDISEVSGWLVQVAASGADGLVAVGGGSVLDAAKLMAAFTPDNWRPDLRQVPESVAVLPWVAVPTTTGTGSEFTPYASFTGLDGRKFSFDDRCWMATAVVHDPALLVECPTKIAGPALADALSQAIESIWAVRGSALSRERAAKGLAALARSGERAYSGDPESQASVQWAAAVIGAGIAESRTTAVHAASYPFTARHGIAHGRALAALLPGYMRWTGSRLTPSIKALICESLAVSDWAAGVQRVCELLKSWDLVTSPRDLGLTEGQLEALVSEGARADRLANHPEIPDAATLSSLICGGETGGDLVNSTV